MSLSPFGIAPLPQPGAAHDLGIAVIGAGAIVNEAHLPAYRNAGLRVMGIFDLDQPRAHATARRFALPRVYASLDELLADPTVQIVDIAVPPWAQAALVPRVSQAGRHLLCQKPLAETVAAAAQMAAAAHQAGVTMAVNLNMRWSPAIRVLRALLTQGLLGQVTSVSFQANFWDSWQSWPWLQQVGQLLILYDAIHLIDALRFLFGEPDTVFAVGARFPGQAVCGETQAILTFAFPSGCTAFIHDSTNNWGGDTYATFRIEGTQAMVKGTLGIWYDYPTGRADTISLTSRANPGHWETHDLPGRWVPDAFAWTMAELLDAVTERRAPTNSADDHLQTLCLIEAIYASMKQRAAIHLPIRAY